MGMALLNMHTFIFLHHDDSSIMCDGLLTTCGMNGRDKWASPTHEKWLFAHVRVENRIQNDYITHLFECDFVCHLYHATIEPV